MSNKKDYPEWGLFGEAIENPKAKPNEQEGSIGNGQPSLVEWAVEHRPGGIRAFVPYDTDTPEQKREMMMYSNLEDAKAKLGSPDGNRYRLQGKRDGLTAVIELARALAADSDDTHSVWASLVALAESIYRPPPLLGLTDDGTAVRYRSETVSISEEVKGTGKTKGDIAEQFTFKALKKRLERRKEKPA
jgi:hypothetical protein